MSAQQTARASRTAAQLATQAADAFLPCPVCAGEVRAANLAGHIAKSHGGASREVSTGPDEFVGADHRITRVFIALFFVSLVAAFVPVALNGGHMTGAQLAAGGIPVLVIFILSGVAAFNVFRARLVLDGNQATLRYAFGLRSRRVAIEDYVEFGGLWTVRTAAGTGWEHTNERVKAGEYLGFVNNKGKRRITVGCPRPTAARKHWSPAGWQRGKSTRFWDLTIPPEAMVALEYALAARGVLTPRTGNSHANCDDEDEAS